MRWDILGLGACAIDNLLFVDQFPQPDIKMQVRYTERHGGGLTATALVTGARLGLRCGYGDLLDESDEAAWILADLERDRVDTRPLTRDPRITPVQAFIIVDSGSLTRTILHTAPQHVDDRLPSDEMILAARLLFVDGNSAYGARGLLHAVKVARAANIPVVADFEQPLPDELIHAVDHLIVPLAFAVQLTGARDPAAAVRGLWHDARALAGVTAGEDGAWFTVNGADVTHQPIFPVDVVDTTGCGDVFHGAYAAALLWGADAPERVQLATAAAAMKATKPGGRQGIPTRPALEQFLRSTL